MNVTDTHGLLRFLHRQVEPPEPPDRRRAPVVATLATVGLDDCPNSRSVILRGLTLADRSLQISTHAQAPKVAELQRAPNATIVIWFPRQKLQFRLAVLTDVLTGSTRSPAARRLRSALWHRHSIATQASFYLPPPGLPVSELKSPSSLSVDRSKPPASFAILHARIHKMDVLHLRRAGHLRYLHASEGARWTVRAISP